MTSINIAAKELRNPKYRKRIVRSRKHYSRKVKKSVHREEKS